jgi:hypothetical protein
MMQTARWLIDHDPDTTRQCFARRPIGTGCTCSGCRNFDAAAGRTFPADFIALLHSLGVDPTKPSELAHYCREPSGLYLTGGWFHFVGSIISGEDVVKWVDSHGTYHFEKLGSGCEFGFSKRLALVPKQFAGLPTMQLEFVTRVPWVLAEAEPENAK